MKNNKALPYLFVMVFTYKIEAASSSASSSDSTTTSRPLSPSDVRAVLSPRVFLKVAQTFKENYPDLATFLRELGENKEKLATARERVCAKIEEQNTKS